MRHEEARRRSNVAVVASPSCRRRCDEGMFMTGMDDTNWPTSRTTTPLKETARSPLGASPRKNQQWHVVVSRRTCHVMRGLIWTGSLLLVLLRSWMVGPLHWNNQSSRATTELLLYSAIHTDNDNTMRDFLSTPSTTTTPLTPSLPPSESRPFADHAIPYTLLFTHSTNLLEARFPAEWDNRTGSFSASATATEQEAELMALQQNVFNITALHPGANIRFLTDADCVASIRAFFDSPTNTGFENSQDRYGNRNHSTAALVANELIRYFLAERQGMYKADLCRGTALYETGGIYLDVDVGVRMPLWTVLRSTTEFATVRVHRQSHYPGAFFQAFMASTPRHAVLERYVTLFLQYYRGTIRLPNDKGPLGVLLLKRAYDEVEFEQKQQSLVSKLNTPTGLAVRRSTAAVAPFDSPPASSNNNNSTTTISHLTTTSELWQEILYLPQFQSSILAHVPPPTWGGSRRACHFVVATSPHVLPLVVPLYSRIAGSRMCPKQPHP